MNAGRVRSLDAEAPAAPWSLPAPAFEQAVAAAIAKLDPALRRFVTDAEIFVVSLPGHEVIADGIDPRAPMLLDGIATPERPGPPCARLFVYQRNIERIVAGPPELHDELLATLEHEVTATFLEDRRTDPSGGGPRAKHEMN